MARFIFLSRARRTKAEISSEDFHLRLFDCRKFPLSINLWFRASWFKEVNTGRDHYRTIGIFRTPTTRVRCLKSLCNGLTIPCSEPSLSITHLHGCALKYHEAFHQKLMFLFNATRRHGTRDTSICETSNSPLSGTALTRDPVDIDNSSMTARLERHETGNRATLRSVSIDSSTEEIRSVRIFFEY